MTCSRLCGSEVVETSGSGSDTGSPAPEQGSCYLLPHSGHVARCPDMAQEENTSDSSHSSGWILRAGKFHGELLEKALSTV